MHNNGWICGLYRCVATVYHRHRGSLHVMGEWAGPRKWSSNTRPRPLQDKFGSTCGGNVREGSFELPMGRTWGVETSALPNEKSCYVPALRLAKSRTWPRVAVWQFSASNPPLKWIFLVLNDAGPFPVLDPGPSTWTRVRPNISLHLLVCVFREFSAYYLQISITSSRP